MGSAPGGVCSRGGLLPGVCLVETPRRLLLRAVRILLECILVVIAFNKIDPNQTIFHMVNISSLIFELVVPGLLLNLKSLHHLTFAAVVI